MTLTTPRYALRYPQTTDPDAVPLDMNHLATDVDNKMVGYSQGTLAARPAFGTTGREYRATDTGFLYLDIGTAWVVKAAPKLDGSILAWNAAFPASPFDGQECDRFADAASRMIWRFRYDSGQAAGQKWCFMGGAPLEIGIPSYAALAGAPTLWSLGGTSWGWSGSVFTPGITGYYRVKFELLGACAAGMASIAVQLNPQLGAGALVAGGPDTGHAHSMLGGTSAYSGANCEALISLAGGTSYQGFMNSDQASVVIAMGLIVEPWKIG